ncbi:MAG: response regulator [Patescibacteria group bacterium]
MGQQEENIVMLVDDQPAMLELSRRILEQSLSDGLSLQIFDNPEKALTKLAQNPQLYPVVVTDGEMPEMSGAELLAEIRKIQGETQARVAVILRSGNIQRMLEQAARLGVEFDEVLAKPVANGEFVAAIRRGLEKVGCKIPA